MRTIPSNGPDPDAASEARATAGQITFARAASHPADASVAGEAGAGIPDIVIRRLPIYVRTLRALQEEGVGSVSSEELANRIGVTAAQIRRDLSYFGKFGKQGKGYDVGFLAETISRILKLDREWDVALAGFGNLGRAIAHYRGFVPSSFRIAAIFDQNPEHIGRELDGLIIQSDERIEAEIARLGIRIGIVAVPASAAQEVAERMITGGVRALLNYAPLVLKVPPGVIVREIDPISALQSMTYYLDETLTAR
jgi:redox-sensing transcriptional repressor